MGSDLRAGLRGADSPHVRIWIEGDRLVAAPVWGVGEPPLAPVKVDGGRKGEIQKLEWRDVDLAEGVIRLRAENSKNKRGRVLVLRGDLKDLIDRRRCERLLECPYVFHTVGRKIGDFGKAWATACAKAGVPGRLFHDLRRTAIRNMVRAGVPEAVAMRVSGHRTRAVFDRYNIVSEQDLAAAMEQTSDYVAR